MFCFLPHSPFSGSEHGTDDLAVLVRMACGPWQKILGTDSLGRSSTEGTYLREEEQRGLYVTFVLSQFWAALGVRMAHGKTRAGISSGLPVNCVAVQNPPQSSVLCLLSLPPPPLLLLWGWKGWAILALHSSYPEGILLQPIAAVSQPLQRAIMYFSGVVYHIKIG